MSRWKRRVDRIKSEIDIVQVLSDYGYRVNLGGGEREQQFSCDLHGSGQDNKPSARVYPGSASWYCFACDQTRDAIETVRAKENLDFKDALKFLEQKFGLPQLPFEDDELEALRTPKPNLVNEIAQKFDPTRSFADDLTSLRKSLLLSTRERELPMDTLLGFWEATDAVAALVEQQQATEAKGREALAKVRTKLDAALFGEPA